LRQGGLDDSKDLLRLVWGEREADAEGGTFGGLALDADFASVGLGNPLSDGETQTGASRFASAGTVCAVETIEDVGHVVGGDANAGVANFGNGIAVVTG
jgi:hypothetical protein